MKKDIKDARRFGSRLFLKEDREGMLNKERIAAVILGGRVEEDIKKGRQQKEKSTEEICIGLKLFFGKKLYFYIYK